MASAMTIVRYTCGWRSEGNLYLHNDYCTCVCGLPIIYYLGLSSTLERSQMRSHRLFIGTVAPIPVHALYFSRALRSAINHQSLRSSISIELLHHCHRSTKHYHINNYLISHY